LSLKTFHIFFIIASILLSDFFGFWQTKVALATHSKVDWFLAILSFLVSSALVVYLFWFIRKMKKTS